jgi:uncharacterized protein (DUF1778 family)
MASAQAQISAFVSEETRDMLEAFASAHGLKKGWIVEQALRHHLQALRELPADVIVPTRLTVTDDSFGDIVEAIEQPRAPTEAMLRLVKRARDLG